MTKLELIARVAQLSAMQTQMVAMAIELKVEKDDLVTETAKAFDDQTAAYNKVLEIMDTEVAAALITALKEKN